MNDLYLFTDSHQYFLYAEPVNMNKSFDGLCGIVSNELERAFDDKGVYIFLNRDCSHVKLLIRLADRFGIIYQRLDKGRFRRPSHEPEKGVVQLSATHLISLLHGLNLH
jgi:transposase